MDLYYAAENGSLEEVKQLISSGADVNWRNPWNGWVRFFRANYI